MPRRPKALIVISSARHLPLSEPEGDSISTGFFLVELAAVMAQFEATHDFVLATPDGKVPQVDINGLALAMQAGGDLGMATARLAFQSDVRKLDFDSLREKNPGLVTRRSAELDLARRLLGRMPVSEVLPGTDREAASIRDDVVASLASLPEKDWLSIPQLLAEEGEALADFDFVHMPGGHAPMVDFHDNPQMGELLHRLREAGVPISLICHAPVALTSARYRVAADGTVSDGQEGPFKGATITTVPKYGELGMLMFGYPKVPGETTRLMYFVNVALEEAGYDVKLTLNPASVRVLWDGSCGVLTGNGPQSVDEQAVKLAEIVTKRAG